MKKNFLLLLLLTLLPLAGWATDYEVQVTTFNGTATWTGTKPAVQPGWFTAEFVGGGAPNATQKALIATALQVKDLTTNPNYNVGAWDYQLELSGSNTVSDDDNNYTIFVNSSTTAKLTITKYTENNPSVTVDDLQYVDGDLTYTGSAQELLKGGATATANGFSVPVIYTLDPTAETVVKFDNYADVKATDAGNYTVYYKVAETDNYNGSDWTELASGKSIAKATTATFNVSAATGLVFDNTDQALLALTDGAKPIVPFGLEGLQYQIDGGEWTAFTTLDAITGKSAKNGAAYAVKFKIPETANWENIESAAINVTIAKATTTFTTEPTFADEFEYDGQAHQLITNPGVAEFGATPSFALRYKRAGSNTFGGWITIHGSNWSENYELRTATNAGVYEIAYCTKTTDDLIKADTKYKRITVLQKEIPTDSYTAPAANENLKANGGAQALITAGSWNVDPALGEFQYKVGEGAWGNTVPQETPAGTYTVYSKIVATSNYKDVDLGSVDVTIAAKDQVTIAIPAGQSFGYGTTPTLEYTADWGGNQGDDALDEAGLTWSWFSDEAGTTPATPGAIGDYYVKVNGLAVTGPTAASKEIVYPTAPVLVKITAGQVNASISGEATYGSLPTFTLTHVSGLSESEAASFDANHNLTTVTVKNGETVLVNGEITNDDVKNALKALAATEYDLEATATLANYNVVVAAGKLNVIAKSIADATITVTTDPDAIVYNNKAWGTAAGNEIEFTVDETSGIEAADYDVAYSNNINAGTATITLTGKRNYAGTKTQNFFIKKASLTIKADDFTGDKAWTYGTTPEPTYTITATGWMDSETPLAVGSEVPGAGIIKVKRTGNNTVGMHTDALEVYFVDATSEVPVVSPEATNYDLTLNKGNLQIAKAGATIQLKADVAATLVGTYGISNADAKTLIETALRNINNYEVVEASMPAAELPYVDVASVTCDLADAEYQVNQNYSFTATGATSTNYGITIVGGSFTVKPAPITLYAKDQAIDWSDTDPNNDTPNTTVSDATVAIVTGGVLKYTDELKDVVASIDIKSQNVGTNNISLTAAENANYNIIVNSDGTNTKYGVLTVTGAPELVLSTADPDLADKLASYNGKSMPVTIDFTARNGRTLGATRNWEKEYWVTMTLPFNISVADLSQKLGYAIVNVIDAERTEVNGTDSKFYGKLTMKGGNGRDEWLVANKPFLVKIADNIADRNNGVIDFGLQTIVAPASEEDLKVDAGKGAKFVGTYKTKPVSKADNANIWFMLGNYAEWAYITSDATWNIVPFEAYIDMTQLSGAPRNMTFVFEEIDGSTTAITSIEAGNLNSKLGAEGWYTLNGVKLQNAPTQKGVYIKDGKKVVVK